MQTGVEKQKPRRTPGGGGPVAKDLQTAPTGLAAAPYTRHLPTEWSLATARMSHR